MLLKAHRKVGPSFETPQAIPKSHQETYRRKKHYEEVCFKEVISLSKSGINEESTYLKY